jgi:hypothetical protein
MSKPGKAEKKQKVEDDTCDEKAMVVDEVPKIEELSLNLLCKWGGSTPHFSFFIISLEDMSLPYFLSWSLVSLSLALSPCPYWLHIWVTPSLIL